MGVPQPDIKVVSQKMLRYFRKHQGQLVTWKELANVADARPERVKDAISYLTGTGCLPIRVSGSGCVYENSKSRRNNQRVNGVRYLREGKVASKGSGASQVDIAAELRTLRDGMVYMAASIEVLEKAIESGQATLPRTRNAEREGEAIKALREDRGVSQATLAEWMGKTEIYIADLEAGKRIMTEKEAREFVRELRIDGSVFNSKLGQGDPVFAWTN